MTPRGARSVAADPRGPAELDMESTERVLRDLEKYHRSDFSYERGQILGSMCTAPHPLAVQAHLLFLTSNLGDPGHFPGAKKIEDAYAQGLLTMVGSGPRGSGSGQVTSGGSEANILALALMREASGRSEVIVPRTGHFSLEKAAKFMKLRLRLADVDDAYRVRPQSVRSLIGPKTAGIIGIAGTTQVGAVDPIEELGEIAQENDLPLHVDAAFGGYILPFLSPRVPFGFDVPGVTSLTMDSHKMGMSTLGVGALLVRDAALLDPLAVETPYLSVARQRGVLGTRSGAPVAAAWALLEALGPDGYRRVVQECLRTTRHLVRRLDEHGLEPLLPPELNIIAVPAADPVTAQDALSRRGWRTNVLPRLEALRIVCMPHVTPEIIDAFVPDLVSVLESTGGAHRVKRALAPAG